MQFEDLLTGTAASRLLGYETGATGGLQARRLRSQVQEYE